jgi:hypothetical protein
MSLYVIKTFDARGRFIGIDEFPAEDDCQAQSEMKPLLRSDWSQELWCASRQVGARSHETLETSTAVVGRSA